MRYPVPIIVISLLCIGLVSVADADVWKWIDAVGKTHYVDSNRTIYTWVDDVGKVHFGDKPDHPDAIRVQLVWHSPGSLADVAPVEEPEDDGWAHPGETAEEREEREKAMAHACKRATEILDAYLNAPHLYRSNKNGKREILSDKEAAATIADAREKTAELCR